MNPIKSGLDFIAKAQRTDGGFWEYSLDQESDTTQSQKYRTTFATSLIMLALKNVPGSEQIKDKSAKFLLAQKSPVWSWNYWARSSRMTRTQPYPDDLDDTFLALSSLWHHDPTLIGPEAMAAIANLLFETEIKTGGPYTTWLVDKTADKVWHDVDLIVNANIAYFLQLQEIELPHQKELIERAITKEKLDSPYYPSFQPAAYFISRSYTGEMREKLCEIVSAHSLMKKDPHQTALMITTLLQLGYPAKQLQANIDYLIKNQSADGSWPASPMCIGPRARPSGAASLTTALCLEALVLHSQQLIPVPKKTIHPEYKTVVAMTHGIIRQLPQPELKTETESALLRMLAYDKDKQIVLLPWIIARAFGLKETNSTTLRNLAVASLWGWMAYTIYDDFLDNEGHPTRLPSAILANRQLLSTLRQTLRENYEFHTEVDEIMNRLDGANAWEVTHCRGRIDENRFYIDKLPDYGEYWQLAERSLGHTIAGLGVLYSAGLPGSSPEMNALRDFFFHYLIARQLNDDAHDWEDDLSRCHVNAVGVLVIEKWLVAGNKSLQQGVDLQKDRQTLQLIMWESVIDEVCTLIQDHVDAARMALEPFEAQGDTSQLLRLLVPPEKAAKKALDTREQAVKFMASL